MRRILIATALLLAPSIARADEGMWTFHDFPSAKVKDRYKFNPDQAWLDKARMSSARTNNCSASFVSANGLVMTNHHCAHECLAGLSSADHDYVKNGFWAAKLDDEKKCPDLHVDRLESIVNAFDGLMVARGDLARALDTQLASTQRAADAVQIGLTFKARDGGYCRSFVLPRAGTAGLACREQGEWRIPVTAAAQVPAEGLKPAATLPAPVLAAVEARISGEALDADGEQRARLGGWDAKRE